MKITALDTKAYRIPPSVPWEDATHVVPALEFIVTTIETDEGIRGTGLTYTVGVGGTAIKALIDDYMASELIGQDPLNVERLWNEMYAHLHRCGTGGLNSLAQAAVDTGLWDILGKFYHQPLYKLLGGAREKIPAYGSGIDFMLDIPELLALMDEYMGQGYGTIKIKIGKDDVEEDLERIMKVKEHIGRDRALLVDANQKWKAAEAIQRMAVLDQAGLQWLEEPIFSDDIEGHARLRSNMRTPLAIGESLYNKYQFLDYLKAGAVDVVQADVARVGGITEWLKIAHLADAWQRPMAPHFLMELSVSLLCGVSNGLILENVKGGSLSEMGVLENSITVMDGFCVPPAEPGHGIRFDERALACYEIKPEELRKEKVRSSKYRVE